MNSETLKTPVAPLFRPVDWLALAITFGGLWIIYLLTLAPEQTLQASGELCTAACYAGVPHPPGYPVWTLYAWVWTHLPFGNIAWRVEVGQSFASALGCGLLALMVSRGGSWLIAGMAAFKNFPAEWEKPICLVAGAVAGLLLGLDQSLWSGSVAVNQVAVGGVSWLIAVLACLMRWIHAPQQRRYLYLAMFLYGLCAGVHEFLMISAFAVEILIALAAPRLGRDLFLANSLIYGLCVLLKNTVPALHEMSSMEDGLFHLTGWGSLLAGLGLSAAMRGMASEWKSVLILGVVCLAGVSLYLYEPVACMTDPPMQWGYPRTVEGFFHTVNRGQYNSFYFHPTLDGFLFQVQYLAAGLSGSFGVAGAFLGLVPLTWLWKMPRRERHWMLGLAAVYFSLSVMMAMLINVSPDDGLHDGNQIFFTASHGVFALMVGYGLVILAAFATTHSQQIRTWGMRILLVLFAVLPLRSGLSHWDKCEQRHHWFGYWYGHDMFTPPFTDPQTGKLSYNHDLRAELLKNPTNAAVIYPEMDRSAVLFGGTDPGRFCATYSIFCESFIPHHCQPEQDQKFDRRDCYILTQNALADGTYLNYLRAQYFRSQQQDPPCFSRLFRYLAAVLHRTPPNSVVLDGPEAGSGDSGSHIVEGVCHLLDHTLDRPLTAWGAYVEKKRRARGVYPPAEIHIPSVEDSQHCFEDYTRDVARRQEVAGQAAVMSINGLLCKLIFDRNPTNSFYVEESFPLDWMYPYETPFGIIMKLNREPQNELSTNVLRLDHLFWTQYATRLCGNWITYDTTLQQIADFVDRIYLHNNYKGYTGDRAFIRDKDAQKAFSKLRSSQAGLYFWRMNPTCPTEYRQKTPAAQQALIRETEFALKQAFAFCPDSAEAVYRYVNFLLQMAQTEQIGGQTKSAIRYMDDAILVGETAKKLDPDSAAYADLIRNIKSYKAQFTDSLR